MENQPEMPLLPYQDPQRGDVLAAQTRNVRRARLGKAREIHVVQHILDLHLPRERVRRSTAHVVEIRFARPMRVRIDRCDDMLRKALAPEIVERDLVSSTMSCSHATTVASSPAT